MVETFKYSAIHRLAVILIISPTAILSYVFFRKAFPIENYRYSGISIIVSIFFGIFTIHILKEHFVNIIIDKKGISVRKFYNSYSANWEDIVEYGKDQPFGYGGNNWRYYLKIKECDHKKFAICRQDLKEINRLNALIITKLNRCRIQQD
jgi:hypothetical protein